ncbi:MAG: radical SAM protein, partial [Acidimicrobiia bacterium]
IAYVLPTGEYESGLVDWVDAVKTGQRPHGLVESTAVGEYLTPDRRGLPSHDGYARLEYNGTTKIAAAVEASRGCRHRCRHCPIPVVYDGRLRVVGADAVLGDISNLAGDGVEHVTFGDADFLNAPRHSLDILREAHSRFPHLTYDVTVKVEHILRHRGIWPEMADLGLLFAISAFESVDEETLTVLDKNHTVADMNQALDVLREAGIHVRPTWLPFLPFTSLGDLAGLVDYLDSHRLWPAIDPVQLSIKLLIPEGSLLERHPAVVDFLEGYDDEALTWRWRYADPAVEVLQKELQSIASEASDCGEEALPTLGRMRTAIGAATGVNLAPYRPSESPVPRLTESWFCCAEPTVSQVSMIKFDSGIRQGPESQNDE